MTSSEMLKEVRKVARENGMTFKAMNASFNGRPVYEFINRQTGVTLWGYTTLLTAYEDCSNGFVESRKQN